MPNVVVKLISDQGAELKTKTSREGEFSFAKVPFGAYIMLVEANGFYTHVNSSVIVDTPHEMRFEVTMKGNQKSVVMGGAMGIVAPTSLLDLYLHSDLIAIAHVGRSVGAGTDEKMNLQQIKTDLLISTQLKGGDSKQVISFYYWVWKSEPAQFKLGERALVFLRRGASEDGERLDSYVVSGWTGKSIKELDDESLIIYRQRIEELTAIFQRGNPDPAEIVEWLIRCVEAPATREEGVSKLYEILPLLQSQRRQRNEPVSQKGGAEESTDQSDDNEEDSSDQKTDDNSSKWERESHRLAAALNQDHKTRLADALFAISELTKADLKLVNLIWELRDDRLAPYLVSHLRRISKRAPRLAESLVGAIAHIIGDEDIRRLADDYDDDAEYDKSEDDSESDQQYSTRNRRPGGLTVAAVKRSAMLKDFLKLVEYKTKR